MNQLTSYNSKSGFDERGFTILPEIYTSEEIEIIQQAIDYADSSSAIFMKTTHLFGKDYFVVKSIYFDKPETSNWFVSYHQDLTISVDKKVALDGFGPWTVKQDQFAVQPPTTILENGFTIRIHLDDTNEENSALKIVPGSHLKGIYRPETIDLEIEEEVSCEVPAGGIMIMKPLLLHSSSRTLNRKRRRVVHIEFSNQELPQGLNWSERF